MKHYFSFYYFYSALCCSWLLRGGGLYSTPSMENTLWSVWAQLCFTQKICTYLWRAQIQSFRFLAPTCLFAGSVKVLPKTWQTLQQIWNKKMNKKFADLFVFNDDNRHRGLCPFWIHWGSKLNSYTLWLFLNIPTSLNQ